MGYSLCIVAIFDHFQNALIGRILTTTALGHAHRVHIENLVLVVVVGSEGP